MPITINNWTLRLINTELHNEYLMSNTSNVFKTGLMLVFTNIVAEVLLYFLI